MASSLLRDSYLNYNDPFIKANNFEIASWALQRLRSGMTQYCSWNVNWIRQGVGTTCVRSQCNRIHVYSDDMFLIFSLNNLGVVFQDIYIYKVDFLSTIILKNYFVSSSIFLACNWIILNRWNVINIPWLRSVQFVQIVFLYFPRIVFLFRGKYNEFFRYYVFIKLLQMAQFRKCK